MGSLGRLAGASLGDVIFANHALKKLHVNYCGGVPSGATTFIVQGGISPHLCNPHNTCVTHLQQRRTKKMVCAWYLPINGMIDLKISGTETTQLHILHRQSLQAD